MKGLFHYGVLLGTGPMLLEYFSEALGYVFFLSHVIKKYGRSFRNTKKIIEILTDT